MAQCRRPLPEEDRRILRAMARPLLRRISQYGWTHAALGERLRVPQAQLRVRLGSQRAMCRVHRDLVRPTVSAVLRDRNSLSVEMLDSILRACGVQGDDRRAWLDAWWRLGWPRREAALERQRRGYDDRTGRRPWR